MVTRRQTDGATQFLLKVLGLLPVEQNPTYPDEGDIWYRSDLGQIFMKRDGVLKGIALTDEGGKLLVEQMPLIGITDVYTVASEAEMLALDAQQGDVAIRTDLSQTYILAGEDPTVLANWQNLPFIVSPVTSVNGEIGDVTLDTTDIAEGTNLYYTAARFNAAFAAKSTTDLAEGTNLYYTPARFDTAFAGKTTTALAEGTNLYYTTARANADFDTRLATKSTTNLAEGTNLYYTDARVRAATLTGFASSDSAISAGDSVLSAFGKAQGQITAKRRNNHVLVKSLSDLPAPVGGVITLVDNTDYEINGTISFGVNTLTIGVNTRMFGISRQLDVLEYTGTGTFMSLGQSFLMNDMAVSCANGTLLSCTAGSTQRVRFHRCQFSGVKTLGSITGGALFELLNVNILNTTTAGFTVSGTAFGVFELVNSYLENNAGTFLALGSSTLQGVKLDSNVVKLSSGQTWLSGSSPVITFSSVVGNSVINSGGTVLSGIDVNDANWFFASNFPLANTDYVGEAYMNGNATVTDITVIGTYIKAAGTTTTGTVRNFTSPATNRLTYVGNFTQTFMVSAVATVACANNNNQVVALRVVKNGVTAVPSTTGRTRCQTSDQPYNVTAKGLVTLEPNDYIEIWITNETSTNSDPTVQDMNFTAVAV